MEVESQRPDCLQDYVRVLDSSSEGHLKQLDKLCNVKKPTMAYYSSWNKMQVILYADEAFANKGFFAEYQSKIFQISESLQKDISFDCK